MSKTTKQTSQAIREPYTWHLRPPFDDCFDASHWWDGKEKKVAPAAALYELVRRHPLLSASMKPDGSAGYNQMGDTFKDGSYPENTKPIMGALFQCGIEAIARRHRESRALACLRIFGLKSWPKLSELEKKAWEESRANIKGVLCQSDDELCYPITLNASILASLDPKAKDCVSALLALAQKGDSGKVPELLAGVEERLASTTGPHKHPLPDPERLEAAIAQCAVNAHREGYVLIAVAPGLTEKQLKLRLADAYRQGRRFLGAAPKERSGHKQWLKLISYFETKPVKSVHFAHYRHALEAVRFPPRDMPA